MSKIENIYRPEFEKELGERISPLTDKYVEVLFDVMEQYGENDSDFSAIHGKYVACWAMELSKSFERFIDVIDEFVELEKEMKEVENKLEEG